MVMSNCPSMSTQMKCFFKQKVFLTGALFLHQIIVHTVVITPEGGIFSRRCFLFFLQKIRLIFLLFFNLVVLFVGKVIFQVGSSQIHLSALYTHKECSLSMKECFQEKSILCSDVLTLGQDKLLIRNQSSDICGPSYA